MFRHAQTFSQAEQGHNIASLVEIGTVTEITGQTVTVQSGELDIPNVRVMQVRAGSVSLSWMPEKDEQVVFVAPAGDLSRAIIIGSLATAGSTASAMPLLELQGGTMQLNGNLAVTGGITTTGDVVADGVSVTTHTHGGVRAGSDQTGGPK